jgi:hypothetical protein
MTNNEISNDETESLNSSIVYKSNHLLRHSGFFICHCFVIRDFVIRSYLTTPIVIMQFAQICVSAVAITRHRSGELAC